VSRESRGGRARRGREVLHLAATRGSSLSCRASVAGVSESSKKKKVNGIGTKIFRDILNDNLRKTFFKPKKPNKITRSFQFGPRKLAVKAKHRRETRI
jgi:hypothetical protein